MSSLPYPKVLEAGNSKVLDTMKSMDSTTGAVIPSNLVQGRTARLGMDNIDTNKEFRIAGHSSGFHGTLTVVYQPGPVIDVMTSQIKFSKEVPNIPECLQTVLQLDRTMKRDPPYVITE